jgi:hypothetical protein
LQALSLQELEDKEQGREPLLAIDEFPLISVPLHDHWLEVIRLVAAVPDVIKKPAYLDLAPSVAPLVGGDIEHPGDVPYQPGLQVGLTL